MMSIGMFPPPTVRFAAGWLEGALIRANFGAAESRNSVFNTVTHKEAYSLLSGPEGQAETQFATTFNASDSGVKRQASLVPALEILTSMSKQPAQSRFQIWTSITNREPLRFAGGVSDNDKSDYAFIEIPISKSSSIGFNYNGDFIEKLSSELDKLRFKNIKDLNPISYTIYPSTIDHGVSWRVSIKTNCRYNPKGRINREKLERFMEQELRSYSGDFRSLQVNYRIDAAVYLQSILTPSGDIITDARQSCKVICAVQRVREGNKERGVLIPAHALWEAGANVFRSNIFENTDENMSNSIGKIVSKERDIKFSPHRSKPNDVDCAFVVLSDGVHAENTVPGLLASTENLTACKLETFGEYFLWRGGLSAPIPCDVIAEYASISARDASGSLVSYSGVVPVEAKQEKDGQPVPLTFEGDSGAALLRKINDKFFICGYVVAGGLTSSKKHRKVQSFVIPIQRAFYEFDLDSEDLFSYNHESASDRDVSYEAKQQDENLGEKGAGDVNVTLKKDEQEAKLKEAGRAVALRGGQVMSVRPHFNERGDFEAHVSVASRLSEEFERDFHLGSMMVRVIEPNPHGRQYRHLRIIGLD